MFPYKYCTVFHSAFNGMNSLSAFSVSGSHLPVFPELAAIRQPFPELHRDSVLVLVLPAAERQWEPRLLPTGPKVATLTRVAMGLPDQCVFTVVTYRRDVPL